MIVLLGLLNHVEDSMKPLVQGKEKREDDRFFPSRSSRDRRMVSAVSI